MYLLHGAGQHGGGGPGWGVAVGDRVLPATTLLSPKPISWAPLLSGIYGVGL